MKNYLKPYTMCTRVESEGYLLAGTGGGTNGQISEGNPGAVLATLIITKVMSHLCQAKIKLHLLRGSSLRAKIKDHGNQITKLKT